MSLKIRKEAHTRKMKVIAVGTTSWEHLSNLHTSLILRVAGSSISNTKEDLLKAISSSISGNDEDLAATLEGFEFTPDE